MTCKVSRRELKHIRDWINIFLSQNEKSGLCNKVNYLEDNKEGRSEEIVKNNAVSGHTRKIDHDNDN